MHADNLGVGKRAEKTPRKLWKIDIIKKLLWCFAWPMANVNCPPPHPPPPPQKKNEPASIESTVGYAWACDRDIHVAYIVLVPSWRSRSELHSAARWLCQFLRPLAKTAVASRTSSWRTSSSPHPPGSPTAPPNRAGFVWWTAWKLHRPCPFFFNFNPAALKLTRGQGELGCWSNRVIWVTLSAYFGQAPFSPKEKNKKQ